MNQPNHHYSHHHNPSTDSANAHKQARNTAALTIGIVAGEVSGDMLGADFMQQMNALQSNIRWLGVGGSAMTAAGLDSLIDMGRLSVMGITEVLRHLPDLFAAKKSILSAFDEAGIDIFIGIDAPDFNLRLGKYLKPKGVFCVQYVSPSIWAWREGRIHGIKSATDLVLCLFPFELPVYAKHAHPAVCVGHPLFKTLSDTAVPADAIAALHQLGVTCTALQSPLVTLMAGSRTGEIQAILPRLLAAFAQMLSAMPSLHAIIPLAKAAHRPLVNSLIQQHVIADHDRLHVICPQTDDQATLQANSHTMSPSQCAMMVSDVTLLASGTATLEAMLLGAPMVVIYQVKALTYHIAKRLLKIPYVALPNILAHNLTGSAIIPELIQNDAHPDAIARTALEILSNPQAQKQALSSLTQMVKAASSENPARAVLSQFYTRRQAAQS